MRKEFVIDSNVYGFFHDEYSINKKLGAWERIRLACVDYLRDSEGYELFKDKISDILPDKYKIPIIVDIRDLPRAFEDYVREDLKLKKPEQFQKFVDRILRLYIAKHKK